MHLKDLQAKIPGAASVAGRVIAFHEGKHRDLGAYVGDGVVKLSPEGEALMHEPDVEPLAAQAPRRAKKASFPGVSVNDLDV